MEFSAREDIEASLDQVFAMVSDFEAIERSALRRGVEVRRTNSIPGPAEGMTWSARFRFRGKMRDADIKLTTFDPPNTLVFDSVSGGLETRLAVQIVALSRRRTRLAFDVTLAPKTLSARLLVQSLKIARGNLNKRFRKRVADYAKDLETRLRGMA